MYPTEFTERHFFILAFTRLIDQIREAQQWSMGLRHSSAVEVGLRYSSAVEVGLRFSSAVECGVQV